jgi:hypothetical protein
MNQNSDKWSQTVFRVRGLPNDVKTLEDVASLLSLRLGDFPRDSIRVYSLAITMDFTLSLWQFPRSKVATVMFQTLPSLIQNSPGKQQWSVPAQGPQNVDNVILDTHFMGMTPLNDVDSNHLFEYTYFFPQMFYKADLYQLHCYLRPCKPSFRLMAAKRRGQDVHVDS